jgi:hypothetical protein
MQTSAGAMVYPRNPGLGVLAYPGFQPVDMGTMHKDRLAVAYGDMGEEEKISTAAAVGIGVGALVLTVGFYVLLAYGIGWGASKGWKAAKKRKK